MKKKSFLLCAIATLLGVGAIGTVAATRHLNNSFRVSQGESATYTMTAGSDEFAALGESFARTGGFALGSATSGAQKVQVNVVGGKKNEGKLVLAPLGKVFNFGTNAANAYSAIHNIKSIKVTFTGDLKVQMAVTQDGLELGEKQALTSTATFIPDFDGSNFFCLSTVSGATIESIEVKYGCDVVTDLDIDMLDNTTFTAETDGVTYQLEISGNTCVLKSLNLETNINLVGNIDVNEDNKIECDVTVGTYPAKYTFDLNAKHDTLSFVSKTGAAAASLPELTFNRVFMIEDFESYTATGDTYRAANTEFNRSGLQGAFFADYGGGGNTSPVGTDGFQLMGSTDFIRLNSDTSAAAFAGDKCADFKANGSAWMRYWQFDQLIGEPYRVGSGAYISMMVKNTAATTVNMKWGSMKTNAALNNTTRNTGDFATVTIPASQDWTEYKVPLTGDSYGWYLAFEKTGNKSTGRVLVDNVMIYSHSPYAKYVAPAPENHLKTMTYNGNLIVADAYSGTLGATQNLFLALGKNGEGVGYVLGQKITVNSAVADEDGNVEIDTSFSYSTVLGSITITKITGVQSGTTLSNVTLTGSLIGLLITNNGSITLSETNALQSSCDGDTTTLKATFERWYNGGSWTVDNNNEDKIRSSTVDPIEGTGCMDVRGYSKFRVTLKNDMAEAKAWTSMGVWVRNDGTKDYTIKFFCYYAQNCSSSAYKNPFSATCPADGQWHYYQSGLDTSVQYYNVSIYFENNSATGNDRVSIDYVHMI